MKTIVNIILAGLALLFAGCVSQVKPNTADTVSAVIRPVAKNAVNLVLAKNPRYADALLALAAASDAATLGGELTPATIKAFVDGLALKYDLDRETKLIIVSAIDDVVHAYQDIYGQAVVNATDPNVKKYLAAFSRGVREGVAFWRTINSPAS